MLFDQRKNLLSQIKIDSLLLVKNKAKISLIQSIIIEKDKTILIQSKTFKKTTRRSFFRGALIGIILTIIIK